MYEMMERRFDMNDFEQSLKDHADQFKLMPSKRVWNGIYNDLHPGSKWPSITVGIIFLITLISIGNLNNKSTKAVNKEKSSFLSSAKKISNIDEFSVKNRTVGPINNLLKESVNSTTNKGVIEKSENSKRTNNSVSSSANARKAGNTNKTEDKNNVSLNDGTLNNVLNHSAQHQSIAGIENIAGNSIVHSNDNSSSNQKSNFISFDEKQNLPSIILMNQTDNSLQIEIAEAGPTAELISYIPTLSTLESFSPNNLPDEMESVQLTTENKLFNLRKVLRKKNKNTEWVFYVTPDISTVSFDHKTIHPSIPSNSASIVVLPNQTQTSLELMPNPRIGFETGLQVKTKVAKDLKVVAGLNFSHSSYNNISNVVHPTFATLTMRGNYGTFSKSYITYYGNGQTQNHISLTNYNFQLSLPIGFEYTIWGNKKVAIDIQSVIEPSAVLKSNAYLLSSDGRYYVNDPTLLRKINLGGNFGSFISFSSNNIRWHIGPNIRYQFLSSYKNIYTIKEHFLDYGIRIGISKIK